MKEKDYDFLISTALNLTTDIIKENLLNVIRALEYDAIKWKKGWRILHYRGLQGRKICY